MKEAKGKLTKREASLLGTVAARPVIERLKQERIAEYNRHPLICKNCHNPIPYTHKIGGAKMFCSRSCRTQYYSKLRPPKSLEIRQKISDTLRKLNGKSCRSIDRKCVRCGKPIGRMSRGFCSLECCRAYAWEKKKEEIERTGTMMTNHCGETDARNAKRYLKEIAGAKCSKCGASEINGMPIPLQVHHVDGNAMNSSISNLVLLCPTCHALTENFGCRNGHRSSRASRKLYWTTKSDRDRLHSFEQMENAEDRSNTTLPISDMRVDLIPIADQVELEDSPLLSSWMTM